MTATRTFDLVGGDPVEPARAREPGDVYRRRRRMVVVVAALVVAAVAIVYHAVIATRLVFPGHADPSYYYSLARSLREGHGFNVDYTWQYLNYPRSVHSLPNDYWMPLPSIFMAGAFFVFGESVPSAVIVPMLAWLGAAFLTGVLAKRLTGSLPVAGACVAGTLMLPTIFRDSFLPDGTLLLAFFGLAVLVVLLNAESRPLWYAGAGALVALAELSRQDGLLFGLTVAVSIIVLGRRGMRLRAAGAALAAYLVVMMPMFVANLHFYGSLLQPAPRKTAFLMHYNDLYTFGRRLDASTYFKTPLHVLVEQRRVWFLKAWHSFQLMMGGAWFSVVLIGTTLAAPVFDRAHRREWIVALVFPAVLLVFHPLVLPVISAGGGFQKSIVAACPLLVIGVVSCVNLIRRAVWNRWPDGRVLDAGAVAMVVVLVALGIAAVRSDGKWASIVHGAREVQKDIVVSRAAIYPDRHAVVMTSYPWELNLLTGQPAVQTPEGSFATLLHVACLTHAKYLQVGGATRSSLDDLARNVKRSQALVPLAPEIGLYEFEPCHRSPNS